MDNIIKCNETLPTSVAVLGSTGSVGRQSLDVARLHHIKVDFLSANRDADEMERQVREFSPRYCAMADEVAARDLKARIADTNTKVFAGDEGILAGLYATDASAVVNAILGAAGLRPTLATIDTGRRLALSNKESLVLAGEIVMHRAREAGVEIIPVDSEHSAIFQCLAAGRHSEVKRLVLTASGGPFFGRSRKELASVTVADALAHPTWKMGAKITVDSATMMNKGFEVIEAYHLFGVSPERIKVLVHRESIMHSAVEYIDNIVIAQLSIPDMRECVQYALTYPARMESPTRELDFVSLGRMTFAEPDTEAFPLLPLAIKCAADGGVRPCVLNAANEIAVAAFLEGKLSFNGIFDVVSRVVESIPAGENITINDIFESDLHARALAAELI